MANDAMSINGLSLRLSGSSSPRTHAPMPCPNEGRERMSTVYHPSPTNSTFFTTCCRVAITDSEANCPRCKEEVTPRSHRGRWEVAHGHKAYIGVGYGNNEAFNATRIVSNGARFRDAPALWPKIDRWAP